MSEPYDAPAIVTFARELQAWRNDAGLNKKQLADALGFTDSYVGQVELCKNIPSEEFAEALDTYFKTNGLFERLRTRILETRHYSVIPPGFPAYLKHEVRSDAIRNFSPNLVPGLLQSRGYAQTVLGANQVPEIVEQLLHERLKRQEIFNRDMPPRTWFLMDEAVLRRVVGSREVMREQLSHIMEFSERPTNMVHIVPLSVGFHDGLGGMFTILGFEDGTSVAYTESGGEGVLFTEPSRIAKHLVRYDLVRGYVLDVTESRALIRTVMEEL
ncbi:helix-turn-helix domain-containing protein [Actinomadura macra]|uniref:helix-turn-helix domain-containing protein n=1 Tax=Actinomadura macra TaxID=46164 RepID=UPI00147195F7|nr:helix-turn-helix transcriptional regulator [Actinomadura macra]